MVLLLEMKAKYRQYSGVSEARKRTMSRIHGKDTNCELVLRHTLWHYGYRYRKNYKKLPGSPDICITKYKLAIFCDSDYFHGRDWNNKLKEKVMRGNNNLYWTMKIQENIDRDNKVDAQLRGMGWTVIHFWSSDIIKNVNACVDEVNDMIELMKEEDIQDDIC